MYSVPVVDRRTGDESERSVEAISASDAEAIVGEDAGVFVGRAKRADGVAEASVSPFDRVSYLGYDPSEEVAEEFAPKVGMHEEQHHANSPASEPRRHENSDIRELIEVTKLVSDRLAWIQSFLVWTFYGISLLIACWMVSMVFLAFGAADDHLLSPWYLMPVIPITICVGILVWLLRTIYPSFRVRPRCDVGWGHAAGSPRRERRGR